ncbi:hypothetical protein L195_g048523, partial [Trifolium pratense]
EPDVMIPGSSQDLTVVSEPMVVDPAPCVKSLPDKVGEHTHKIMDGLTVEGEMLIFQV